MTKIIDLNADYSLWMDSNGHPHLVHTSGQRSEVSKKNFYAKDWAKTCIRVARCLSEAIDIWEKH